MRDCETCGPRCPITDTSSHKICGICRKAAPSIRTAAALIGKAPSTLMRWKRTNPELYRAVMEYATRHDALTVAEAGKIGGE